MIWLVAAALNWILIHRLIAGGSGRAWLVGAIGERGYQLLFAIISAVSLAALYATYIYAYARPPAEPPSPLWLVLVIVAVHLMASVLVVAGLSTVNPGTSGLGSTVTQPGVIRGMLRVTRHPFLWGVVLWTAAHLLVRHDAARLLFFGSLGGIALLGTLSIDRKRRDSHGDAWRDFARKTSSVPFLAIIRGSQRLSLREIGVARLAIGVLLWAAMLVAHPWLSGGSNVLRRIAP